MGTTGTVPAAAALHAMREAVVPLTPSRIAQKPCPRVLPWELSGPSRPQPRPGRRASSPRITQHKSFLSPPQGPFITGLTPRHAWLDRGILPFVL